MLKEWVISGWHCTLIGPIAPDDRNMLNENMWSPDRPTLQGIYRAGIAIKTALASDQYICVWYTLKTIS